MVRSLLVSSTFSAPPSPASVVVASLVSLQPSSLFLNNDEWTALCEKRGGTNRSKSEIHSDLLFLLLLLLLDSSAAPKNFNASLTYFPGGGGGAAPLVRTFEFVAAGVEAEALVEAAADRL